LEEHDQPDYVTYGHDYSNTWKGEVRAVTQTQTGAFEHSTESELRAVLAQLAKDITLIMQNTAGAVSMGSPASITYEKTVAPRESVSMHESNIAERQPPYARRFVTVKGKRLEAAPTLPGKHYFSDAIEDAVFETDAKNSSVTYKGWNGDCEHLLIHTEEMGAWYNTFFEPKVDKKFRDTQVTARVGFQHIHIKDLKTLGPGEWLNDTIIDRMTDVLASKSDNFHGGVEKSKRRVAGFDSQFKMIHETPISDDPIFNREFYHYDRVRKYADRRLRGWSPMIIDCMIFPNNIAGLHWNLIIVYLKQRHIVGLDSMHGNSREDARTIFRWLFDETSFNYPGDVDTLWCVSPWLCCLRVV
jgi:hypothetical protein